jgi:hypothetical protein
MLSDSYCDSVTTLATTAPPRNSSIFPFSEAIGSFEGISFVARILVAVRARLLFFVFFLSFLFLLLVLLLVLLLPSSPPSPPHLTTISLYFYGPRDVFAIVTGDFDR